MIMGCVTEPEGHLIIPDKLDQYEVTRIGEAAFYHYADLTGVTLPQSVTFIADGAFANSGLTSVSIPGSVTVICYGTFMWCEDLTRVTIPEGVTRIEMDAFHMCASLTRVTVPGSVTRIVGGAFDGCDIVTLIVTEGSFAEQYAQEKGIAFAYAE